MSVKTLAEGFVFTPTFETSLISQEAKGDRFVTNDKVDSQTLSILPGFVAAYQSKRLNAAWTASHNHLQRRIDSEHLTDNFTNYNYSADLVLIDRVLSLQASGTLSNRNLLASDYLVNDPLLGGDDLSKTRSNAASLVLQLPTNSLFGFNASASYSTAQSERRTDSSNNLDNDSYSANSQFYQGNNWKRLSWQVTSNFQQTERSNQQDFKSRQLDGTFNIGLFADIALTFRGQQEANQGVGGASSVNTGGLLREYNSYGVGFSYRQSANRFVTITYNEGDQSEQEQADSGEEKERFVGVDLNWNFTSRTSVSGNYGRRFYGESGVFSLSHATRHLRTSINYNEELTTFTRLISRPGAPGVFVCPANSTVLANCFQPDSLNYQLNPGEQFVQFSRQIPEISDEVILRKSFSGQLGFERRRLSLSLDGQYSLNEYIETGRQQRTYSAGISSSLKFGAYTSFQSGLTYAVTDDRNRQTNNGESETWQASMGISRSIGRSINLDLDLRYVDRASDIDQGDLKERRLSLTFRYDFNQ